MKLGIMQPYFLPYIGYFQLIAAVDKFIIYDNIKYTKKGWINRNRFLQNGSDSVFSLPLKKDSDSLDVVQRYLSTDYDRFKLLNKLKSAYQRASEFNRVYPIIEKIILCDKVNLFHYVYYSIVEVCNNLDIKTEIVISSDIQIDHALRGQDKVIALCKTLGASTYINPIGGIDLYSKESFIHHGINLLFIKPNFIEYAQYEDLFVPWLSIVDVLMFNSKASLDNLINNEYELI